MSPIAGALTNTIGYRWTVICGASSVAFGFISSSFATAVWQLYFTYGIFIGGGLITVFLPCLGCTGQWFEKRRGLAVGIGNLNLFIPQILNGSPAISGGGFGTMVLPPVLEY